MTKEQTLVRSLAGLLGWSSGCTAAEGLSGGQAAEQLAQRISLSLHRENARAVVRRLVLPEPGHADSGPLWPPFAADDDPL